MAENHKATDDFTFRRVVDYFLGHAKPKDDGVPKRKRSKAKKRVPRAKAAK